MPDAARCLTDLEDHLKIPLGPPGPGSADIEVGFFPAWRGLPLPVAAALAAPAAQVTALMTTDKLDKAPIWNEQTGKWELPAKLQQIQGGMIAAGNACAQLGHAPATEAVNQSFAALQGRNDAACEAWDAADVAERQAALEEPQESLRQRIDQEQGLPQETWAAADVDDGRHTRAAAVAYQQAMQKESEKQMRDAMFATMSITDVHFCKKPPPPILFHGPGVVFKGSATVEFNFLPAARKDDKLVEVPGGSNVIKMGFPTVEIGG